MPLPFTDQADRDLAACVDMMRGGSKTFFAASRLLPRRLRDASIALYAFCRVADDLVDQLAVLEQQQRRNAAHVVLDGRARVLVDVQLADGHLAGILRGQLIDGWTKALARAAPLRPEIDEDGLSALEHGLVEVGVGKGLNVLGCH